MLDLLSIISCLTGHYDSINCSQIHPAKWSGEPQAYGYLEEQRSVLHNQPVPEGDVIMEIFDVSPRGEAYYIDPVEESRDLYTGSHSSTPWGDIAPAPNYYCPSLLQHTAHLLAVGGDDDSDKPIPTIAMHNSQIEPIVGKHIPS